MPRGGARRGSGSRSGGGSGSYGGDAGRSPTSFPFNVPYLDTQEEDAPFDSPTVNEGGQRDSNSIPQSSSHAGSHRQFIQLHPDNRLE